MQISKIHTMRIWLALFALLLATPAAAIPIAAQVTMVSHTPTIVGYTYVTKTYNGWGGGKLGIFGKLVKTDTVLRDKDRIEIYRPLIADPKEVRRRRAEEGKAMKKGGDI